MNKKQKIAKRKQKKARLRLKAKKAALLKNKNINTLNALGIHFGIRTGFGWPRIR